MNLIEKKHLQTPKRSTITISAEIVKKVGQVVKELNGYYNQFEKNNELESFKTNSKKRILERKKSETLTVKTFTETALLHFVKQKIDPRFYEDGSIGSQINKLRNHILGFIVKQETTLLKPFHQDLIQVKNQLGEINAHGNTEGLTFQQMMTEQNLNALAIQSMLIGMINVVFEIVQLDEKEKTHLENLFHQKSGEYFLKNQNQS